MKPKSSSIVVLHCLLLGAIQIFVLGACNSGAEEASMISNQPTMSLVAESLPSETPIQEEITQLTATSTEKQHAPTATPDPSPTPTRLPANPWGRMTYSLPELAGPITASNLGVKPLALWGRSHPKAMAFSADGSLIGINTDAGPFFYDANSLALVQYDDEFYTQIFPNRDLHLTNNLTNMILYRDGDLVLDVPGYPNNLSPGGSYLAGENGEQETIAVYSTHDGKPTGAINLWDLEECISEEIGVPFVVSFAVTESGKTLAIMCGGVNEVHLFNIEDGEKISTLDTSAVPYDLSPILQFSPDSSLIAVHLWEDDYASSKTGVWKTEDGSFVTLLSGIDPRQDSINASFSPDNTKLLISKEDGQVFLLDIRLPDEAYPLHPEALDATDVDFSPDGSRLLIPFNRHFMLIDPASGQILEDVALEEKYATYGDCEEFVFSADGSRLYCTTTDTSAMEPYAPLLSWDPENIAGSQDLGKTGSELKEVPELAALALIREHLMLLDPADGKPIDKILLSERSRDTYDLSADASLLALGEFGGVQVLERNEFNKYKKFEQLEVGKPDLLRFSPDGSRLAVIDNHDLRLFDSKTWGQVAYWEGEFPVIEGWENYMLPGFYDLAFSADGSLMATGAGKDIHLRSAETGELLLTLTGHNYLVKSMAFSPDGTLLASLSWDGTLRLWGTPE